jgi:hypothetical protein
VIVRNIFDAEGNDHPKNISQKTPKGELNEVVICMELK